MTSMHCPACQGDRLRLLKNIAHPMSLAYRVFSFRWLTVRNALACPDCGVVFPVMDDRALAKLRRWEGLSEVPRSKVGARRDLDF